MNYKLAVFALIVMIGLYGVYVGFLPQQTTSINVNKPNVNPITNYDYVIYLLLIIFGFVGVIYELNKEKKRGN